MKVITFSRFFPAYHPKAGQPTYFVEKIWAHLIMSGRFTPEDCYNFLRQDKATEFIDRQKIVEFGENDQVKIHTIRAGSRWKKDDQFSPRVWSGKPYYSPQITFAPPLTVLKTEIIGTVMYYGDEVRFWEPYKGTEWARRPNMKQEHSLSETENIAKNDGLLYEDFRAWFNKADFEGQIIHF